MNDTNTNKSRDKISTQLNNLLANYQVANMKIKSYHWNISGTEFFEMHEKFEEIYQDINERIDELAERIVSIKSKPDSTFTSYLKKSKIEEEFNSKDAKKCSEELLKDIKTITEQEKDIIIIAKNFNDHATEHMLNQYCFKNEKTIWMLDAYNS